LWILGMTHGLTPVSPYLLSLEAVASSALMKVALVHRPTLFSYLGFFILWIDSSLGFITN
jgi:hypothetical protein